MVNFIKAPNDDNIEELPGYRYPKIFLAGSIEMGKAVDWQTEVEDKIRGMFDFTIEGEDITVYNPRRTDWDASWLQDPAYGTQFNEQVSWELRRLIMSNIIIFNFEPGTISPITLLEFGKHIETEDQIKMIVCPPEYHRFGNVKITAEIDGKNFKFYPSRNDDFYRDLGLAVQRSLDRND